MSTLPPPDATEAVEASTSPSKPRHRRALLALAAILVAVSSVLVVAVVTRDGGKPSTPPPLPAASIAAISEATWQEVTIGQRAAFCSLYSAGEVDTTEASFVSEYVAKAPKTNTKADAEAAWRYLAFTIAPRECGS